jgi:hypothetical protein
MTKTTALFLLLLSSPAFAQQTVCMIMDNVGVVRGVTDGEAARTPGMRFPCHWSDSKALDVYFAAQMRGRS